MYRRVSSLREDSDRCHTFFTHEEIDLRHRDARNRSRRTIADRLGRPGSSHRRIDRCGTIDADRETERGVAARRPDPGRRRELGGLDHRRSAADVVLALPQHPSRCVRLRSRSRLPAAARRGRRLTRGSLARLRRRSHHVLGRAARRREARSRRSRHRAEVHRALRRRLAPAVPRARCGPRRQRRARARVRRSELRGSGENQSRATCIRYGTAG